MAGNKKKKKPTANPARGFATTSIASKPRPDTTETAQDASATDAVLTTNAAPPAKAHNTTSADTTAAPALSAEEFEKQLEEAELQILVDKYAAKTKRDAQRQRNRLETDRRLLRGQADSINVVKWFPEELLDYILDLIKAESRFSTSSVAQEGATPGKMPVEEETISRLWVLQHTLQSSGFSDCQVNSVVKHILDISPSVSMTPKDSIWGLEEALEWLARECSVDDLPAYEPKVKPATKDTPNDTPNTSRSATPRPGKGQPKNKPQQTNKSNVTYDMDIEPEELIPQYIETKKRLLELSRNRPSKAEPEYNDETALLQAKLKKIENDVLFDRNTAEYEWKAKKSAVERDLATIRTAIKQERPLVTTEPIQESNSEEMGVNLEAERMAAEILAEVEDEDMALDDLFDSLPQTEVDPTTGESQTVVTTSDGQRLTIKDFGTWSGVNPRRVLEEACRARDSGARIKFRVVSQASFANRHSLDIIWAKPQELPQMPVLLDMEASVEPTVFTFTMNMVATPDMKQSEAYVSTAALFHIFGQNTREEKVYMKLPPIWRDFWSQLSEAKQNSDKTRS